MAISLSQDALEKSWPSSKHAVVTAGERNERQKLFKSQMQLCLRNAKIKKWATRIQSSYIEKKI